MGTSHVPPTTLITVGISVISYYNPSLPQVGGLSLDLKQPELNF